MTDLLPDGSAPTGDARYDALPRAIKDMHPYDSWCWLGAGQQEALQQTETEPEY